MLDASDIHARRLNAKEINTTKNDENFMFPAADGTVRLSGGDQEIRKSTLMRYQPARGEFHKDIFEKVRTGLSQKTQ